MSALPPDSASRGAVQPCLAIVRRGETETFRLLKRELEEPEPDVVEVIWDRRVGERRTARETAPDDRRFRERRGPLPATWTIFGFVIAVRHGESRAGDGAITGIRTST